jgi:hypothetical protein
MASASGVRASRKRAMQRAVRRVMLGPLAPCAQVVADRCRDEEVACSLRREQGQQREPDVGMGFVERALEGFLRRCGDAVLHDPPVVERDAGDPGSGPELGTVLAAQADRVDAVEQEQLARERAAAFRRRTVAPPVGAAEVHVRHRVPRLADDGLRVPLGGQRERERRADAILDDRAQVDVRVRVGETVVGGHE